MKRLYIMLVAMIVTRVLYGQITSDADGKSTITLPSGTFGLEVTKPSIKLNFYGLSNAICNTTMPKVRLFYGGEANAKNSSGISKLFSKGNFVPESDLSGLFGVKVSAQHQRKNDSLYRGEYFIYLRGGPSVQGFKYDLGDTSLNFDQRFRDTIQIGGFGEIGLTVKIRGLHIFGISFGIKATNNFQKLTDTDYRYHMIDSNISNLESTKDFTAYSGGLTQITTGYINFDYALTIPMDDNDRNYFVPGIYLRSNFNSNTTALPNSFGGGLNLNFINGKKGLFLGGIYLESSDFTGQLRKKFSDSISFGLTAKFAFSGLNFDTE